MRHRYHFCGGVAAYFKETTVPNRKSVPQGADAPATSPEFDELMDLLRGHEATDSSRVIKQSGCPAMGAAHMVLDGKEYVVAVTPTDLLPVEDQA